MRIQLLSILALSLLVSAPACTNMAIGSGPVSDDKRDVAAFTRVSVGGSIDAVIEVGPETSVVVEAEESIKPKIRTEVVDGVLKIKTEGSFATSKGVLVRVKTPSLTGLDVAGSGDARVDGLAAPEVTLSISGSGDITAQGATESLSITVAGSGEVHAFALPTKEAAVVVSGSGDVEVAPSNSLNVTVSGSGDVVYRGDPQVNETIAGSGSVRKDG
ncbi:MAG: DUF2807 domain-containing protein [Myxococcales bacterium]|nr:DUF2807 domain-containing protein [Myxococcales bacterium]